MDEQNSAAYQDHGIGSQTLEQLEAAVHYNEWIGEKIRPFLGAYNIEIGAGQGTITQILAKTHRMVVTETSRAGFHQLEKRFATHPNILGIETDFLSIKGERSIDCIYSSNVLEHIEDDLAILKHAAALLKPDGFFVAYVPAGQWLYSDYDRLLGHVRRYGKSDRKRILDFIKRDRLPLELMHFRYCNPIGALGWLVKMKMLGQTQIKPEDALIFDKLVPFVKWLDKFFSALGGQNALIVLKRSHY
jgi:SAM-dependent methyltransferase